MRLQTNVLRVSNSFFLSRDQKASPKVHYVSLTGQEAGRWPGCLSVERGSAFHEWHRLGVDMFPGPIFGTGGECHPAAEPADPRSQALCQGKDMDTVFFPKGPQARNSMWGSSHVTSCSSGDC